MLPPSAWHLSATVRAHSTSFAGVSALYGRFSDLLVGSQTAADGGALPDALGSNPMRSYCLYHWLGEVRFQVGRHVQARLVAPPAALRRMVAARPPGSAEALPRAALTGREEEVLRLMATGLSNPEIAQSLTVSLETVKTHVGNVLTKLGAQNRTHAVVIAYESGLVVPGFAG
ncbi:DNA-binding response regulator, NarL/FixJ family, contains REC and HTH domains [Streptomyces sp. Ncost-T10-10d]|nr:DNA-binding response regulator, NarL/FixJ family, contains REC and HTH domains [Streptomyces sp. Ncost-T10-10d]